MFYCHKDRGRQQQRSKRVEARKIRKTWKPNRAIYIYIYGDVVDEKRGRNGKRRYWTGHSAHNLGVERLKVTHTHIIRHGFGMLYSPRLIAIRPHRGSNE
jgi:hypothetical protein